MVIIWSPTNNLCDLIVIILCSNGYISINRAHVIFETYLYKKFLFIGNSNLTGCHILSGCSNFMRHRVCPMSSVAQFQESSFVLCSRGVIYVQYNGNGCPWVELYVLNIFHIPVTHLCVCARYTCGLSKSKLSCFRQKIQKWSASVVLYLYVLWWLFQKKRIT